MLSPLRGGSTVNVEGRSTANTEGRSTVSAESRSTDVRSWMAQSFRQIDLLDLIKYIQTHRNFSVHQRSSSSSSVHLHQYKNQTVVMTLSDSSKVNFYMADNAKIYYIEDSDDVSTITGSSLTKKDALTTGSSVYAEKNNDKEVSALYIYMK